MFRQMRIGIVLMVAILAIGVGVALSDRGREVKSPPSLAGEWLLDRSHSDFGPGGRGGGGAGEWRGRRGSRMGRGPDAGSPDVGGAGGEGQGGGRRPRLPERIHIDQTNAMVTIADSSGMAIQEIVIGTPAPAETEGNVPTASGEWKKDGLHVVREGPRGKMTQVFALEDKGQVLVIKMKRESGPAREIKRTYRRVST